MSTRRVIQKSTTQLELKLQAEMLKSFLRQRWFATKTSDRFKAGRPDMRLGQKGYGQIDVELKYNDWPLEELLAASEIDSTMTKLQWLKIKEMNEHGMPAICLIYWQALSAFSVTTLLRGPLPPASERVLKLPGSEVIKASELFSMSMEHLNGLGYPHPWNRRAAR